MFSIQYLQTSPVSGRQENIVHMARQDHHCLFTSNHGVFLSMHFRLPLAQCAQRPLPQLPTAWYRLLTSQSKNLIWNRHGEVVHLLTSAMQIAPFCYIRLCAHTSRYHRIAMRPSCVLLQCAACAQRACMGPSNAVKNTVSGSVGAARGVLLVMLNESTKIRTGMRTTLQHCSAYRVEVQHCGCPSQ